MTQSTAPSTIDQTERAIPIDVEHTGIRLVVPILTVLGFVVGYFASSWLVGALNTDVPIGCVAVLAGIGLGVLAAVLADRVLKGRWSSGRDLTLDSNGLSLHDRRKNRNSETRITWDKRVNVVAWRFTVERGSARVPKGWMMLAMKLLQDEAELILYTLMPAGEAKMLPSYDMFAPLASRAAIEKGTLTLREASEQRRLLQAEDERWKDGAEVRHEDFGALVSTIRQHVRPA
jgi:hypothetical protein